VAVAPSVVAVPLSGRTIAIAVTASLLCALYGDVLERRLTGRTRTSSAAKVLLLVLLTLVLFWDVERPANVAGEGFATQIETDAIRMEFSHDRAEKP
jgi:putative Ca2+/H+ antiporter (TMEM165/GDT1 family)